MDREAIARGERRRRIEETLDEERGREQALGERLQEVVTEREGSRIDEHAFARMDAEDVALVREVLEEPSFDEGEEPDDFLVLEREEEDQSELEEEIARLQAEIAASRRRQLAYQRYLEALDS